jgi:hypothetical protein
MAGNMPAQAGDGMLEVRRHAAKVRLSGILPDFIHKRVQTGIRHLRAVDHGRLKQEQVPGKRITARLIQRLAQELMLFVPKFAIGVIQTPEY